MAVATVHVSSKGSAATLPPTQITVLPGLLGLLSFPGRRAGQRGGRQLSIVRSLDVFLFLGCFVCGLLLVTVYFDVMNERTPPTLIFVITCFITGGVVPVSLSWRRRESLESMLAQLWASLSVKDRQSSIKAARRVNMVVLFAVVMSLVLALVLSLALAVGVLPLLLFILTLSFYLVVFTLLGGVRVASMLAMQLRAVRVKVATAPESVLLREFKQAQQNVETFNNVLGGPLTYMLVTYLIQVVGDGLFVIQRNVLQGLSTFAYGLPILFYTSWMLTRVAQESKRLAAEARDRFNNAAIAAAELMEGGRAGEAEAAAASSEGTAAPPLSLQAYTLLTTQKLACQIAGLSLTPKLIGRALYGLLSIAFYVVRDSIA